MEDKQSSVSEKIYLQVPLSDKRIIQLPFASAFTSRLLKDLIEQERESIDAQRASALKAFSSKPSSSSVLSIIVKLSHQLDAAYFSEESQNSVVRFFESQEPDSGMPPDDPLSCSCFQELVDRALTLQYLGIDSAVASLSNSIASALMAAADVQAAQKTLRVDAPLDWSCRDIDFLRAWGCVDPSDTRPEPPENDGDSLVPLFVSARREKASQFPDKSVCQHCLVPVGTLVRSATVCCSCGGTFCADHCSHSPEGIQYPLLNSDQKVSFLGRITGGKVSGPRICEECYRHGSLSAGQNVDMMVVALKALALPVTAVWRLGALSPLLCVASQSYLTLVKALQFNVASRPLTEAQKRTLMSNKEIFLGHSRWMLLLLRAVDWNDKKQEEFAVNMLRRHGPISIPAEKDKSERQEDGDDGGSSTFEKKEEESPVEEDDFFSCTTCLCDVPCKSHRFSVEDCITALNAGSYHLPRTVRQLLVQLLSCASDDMLIAHMPELVSDITYDECPLCSVQHKDEEAVRYSELISPLASFLLRRATSPSASPELVHSFYWQCYTVGMTHLATSLVIELVKTQGARGSELVQNIVTLDTFAHLLYQRRTSNIGIQVKSVQNSGSLVVPTHPGDRLDHIESISAGQSVWDPFFVRYVSAVDEKTKRADIRAFAFLSQSLLYVQTIRLLFSTLADRISRECPANDDSPLSTFSLETFAIAPMSSSCGFADIQDSVCTLDSLSGAGPEKIIASISTHATRIGLPLSDQQKTEALSQLRTTAAFYASFSLLTGILFREWVVTRNGQLVPLDTLLNIQEEFVATDLLPPGLRCLARDHDWLALAARFFFEIRARLPQITATLTAHLLRSHTSTEAVTKQDKLLEHIKQFSFANKPHLVAESDVMGLLTKMLNPPPQTTGEYVKDAALDGLSSIVGAFVQFGNRKHSGEGGKILKLAGQEEEDDDEAEVVAVEEDKDKKKKSEKLVVVLPDDDEEEGGIVEEKEVDGDAEEEEEGHAFVVVPSEKEELKEQEEKEEVVEEKKQVTEEQKETEEKKKDDTAAAVVVDDDDDEEEGVVVDFDEDMQ